MFSLHSSPFSPSELSARLRDSSAGALVSFEGWVRNLNEGRSVVELEYECYAELAEKEGRRIIEEARARFSLLNAMAFHRVGRLAVGDLAVWVGVTAAHRGAAFDACRYIIDEAKARVPIWKKEHYVGGTSQWINCATRGAFAEPGGPPQRVR